VIHKSADDIMEWVRGFVNEFMNFPQKKTENADRSPVLIEEQSALISLITILFFSIKLILGGKKGLPLLLQINHCPDVYRAL